MSDQKAVDRRTADRAQLRDIVEGFLDGWARGDWSRVATTPDARLFSNQHAPAVGRDAIARSLGVDLDDAGLGLQVSNRYVGVRDSLGAASAYIFGVVSRHGSQALFGATAAMTFVRKGDGWALETARLSVNWHEGERAALARWLKPPTNDGWQRGDAPPVLVSELDSPWAVLGRVAPKGSLHEQVSDLYSKYSFAMDQGDMALLADCFAEDAAGGFSPLGPLTGRHAIIGQLKSFRRHWPWMQHFALVVRIVPESDTSLGVIVARIIPQRPVDEQGRAVYGAHYQMRVRLDPDGQWRIAWTDYRPGWFTRDSIPPLDLDRTSA